MILKIDHLAFGSASFDQDIERFASLGYQVQFKQTGLRDLDNKRPFMHQFSGELKMALLVRTGSLAIEILDHGHMIHQPSYLFPVLDMQPSMAGGTCRAARLDWECEQVSRRVAFPAVDFSFNNFIVHAAHLADAIDFWKCLGFRVVTWSPGMAHMEFHSILSGVPTRMFLCEGHSAQNHFWLDAQGFNCLAFFSSNGKKDRRRFAQLGLNPTKPNAFRVNSKDFSIYWVTGPGGEIAEIVGLA